MDWWEPLVGTTGGDLLAISHVEDLLVLFGYCGDGGVSFKDNIQKLLTQLEDRHFHRLAHVDVKVYWRK